MLFLLLLARDDLRGHAASQRKVHQFRPELSLLCEEVITMFADGISA